MAHSVTSAIEDIVRAFEREGYVADEDLATIIYLLRELRRPLLVEGDAGVGKTEIANVLAAVLDTDLIIKIQEDTDRTTEEKEEHIFGERYLLARPLLQAITAEAAAPVLLIDEIDRADEEFEAFLLELLSDFQITIPEMGTVEATHVPYVILTSNRTRELSDALKRRCLYYWLDYPDLEKELRIIERRLPDVEADLAEQIVRFVQSLRQMRLSKVPGVAETLDWAAALLALDQPTLNASIVERTIGCVLKSTDDIATLNAEDIDALLAQTTSEA